MQINQAHYLEDYRIKIEFSDDTVKVVDFGDFLEQHPQYNKYKDLHILSNSK